ncbi:MAG TPA: arginine--tRNA ligase [Syntrophomonas sp.]|nr:arginine--tRNA ligase [Syntrophomonas sp.]
MNPIHKIKEELARMVIEALEKARDSGQLNYELIPEFVIEVPKDSGHGDFACNVAMLLARQAHMAPRRIAEIITSYVIMNEKFLEKVEIAGAGFINFFLNDSWLYEIPEMVIRMADHFGESPRVNKKVQVEFVSANPTGNLHMGNARGGALGDTLANVLARAGYDVEREFYINDCGNQIEIFGQSLEARYLQLMGQDVEFPENGYAGQDVVDTVKNIIREYKDQYLIVSSAERRQRMIEYALQEKVSYIKKTLNDFGINYDVWFSEKTLHDQGKVKEVIDYLRERDYIYEQDGALWFRTTLFGDEKDEVLLRANGLPTYFAADIAYHKDKFDRGFDWVINVWGADHHGHVARMKGAMQAIGYDPDHLDMMLMQLVRLYRGGQIVRMSKRTGTTVSLDELLEDVGRDAARFFFVMRSPDSQIDFDLELAKQQSQENPVYYVQYAHARIMSIFRQAQVAGASMPDLQKVEVDYSRWDAEELQMIRKIADFPEEIAIAARTLAPHRIARYVLDLAGMFHSFYNHHRVLNEDKALQDARLVLMECIRITLKNALDILGVSAPEQM